LGRKRGITGELPQGIGAYDSEIFTGDWPDTLSYPSQTK